MHKTIKLPEGLPAIEDAQKTVVILRLRGREEIGSTFLSVITRYAVNLRAHQGKLVLVGVSEPVYIQLKKTGLLDILGQDNVYQATSIMADSVIEALQDAQTWLQAKSDGENPSAPEA
ncbi:MAG: STAS domain-containing protein [Anaerolineales bacterium]